MAIAEARLIGPVVGLCAWTLVMEVWLYALRIPAIQRSKMPLKPEMTKDQMNSIIPRSSQWPADNYNHLMEQPTQFYATMFALVYLQASDNLTVGLAWTYVGVRIVHSLVQSISNPILTRFRIFALSSLTLLALTVRAVQHL